MRHRSGSCRFRIGGTCRLLQELSRMLKRVLARKLLTDDGRKSREERRHVDHLQILLERRLDARFVDVRIDAFHESVFAHLRAQTLANPRHQLGLLQHEVGDEFRSETLELSFTVALEEGNCCRVKQDPSKLGDVIQTEEV